MAGDRMSKPSQADKEADKSIADVINKLERVQLEALTDESDNAIKGLVEQLNDFSKKYTKRVNTYLEEIQECLCGVMELYKGTNKTPPRTSILYL